MHTRPTRRRDRHAYATDIADGSARTPRQLRRYGVHPRYRDGRPLSTHPPSGGRENLEAPGRHLTLEALAA